MSTANSSSTAPKVSMFAAKSGFVIPKNKLLGSLVPLSKGAKRHGGGDDAANLETSKQTLRKTKWGPDPTQDASVRKCRALAYQTRVDQITQQLKSGTLQSKEIQDSQVAAEQNADSNLSSSQIDPKDLELLKLEWREIIGEILKLNPSYKAPPDYEPLLKEATVPIPVNDHPMCNFLGLIFGPEGENLKRLEKETGAKIQVYGTKANTAEKVEISPLNGNDTQMAYEELNVRVSADTFEKVDGAIAVIELLFTSVSENVAAGNNMNVLNQSQGLQSPFMVQSGDQTVGQSVVGHTQTQQGQFHYHDLQFPAASAQASSFISIPNSSASIQINTVLPLNPALAPSFLGPRPVTATGYNSAPQNTSFVPSRPQMPMQVPSQLYPPRNFALPTSLPASAQASSSVSLPFSSNQLPPTMLSTTAGLLGSSLAQPVLTFAPGAQRVVGNSSGWSTDPTGVPASLGSTGQVPPMASFQGPRPLVPQPGFLSSAPPSSMPAVNVTSSVSFPSALSSVNVPLNPHLGASNFASVPPRLMGPSSLPFPIQSSPLGMAAVPLTNASVNAAHGSMPMPSLVLSTPLPTLQSVNHTLRPTTVVPRPASGPSDFAFQLHHPPNPTTRFLPRQNSHPASQEPRLPQPPMLPSSPHAPSFRFTVPNSTPLPGMHSFLSPQQGVGKIQAQMPPVPLGNAPGTLIPPRTPSYSNASPFILSRNLSPAPQLHNLRGPFPPRLVNPMQAQQNYPASKPLRGSLMAPNLQSSKDISFGSTPGGQQIYDPFSPTSFPTTSQLQGGNFAKGRMPENDPEHEDLAGSIGVK